MHDTRPAPIITLIRHNKRPEDAIRDSDLTAAGVMLLQLWISAATLPELIQRERTIRALIYRNPQSDVEYPDYWR